MAKKQKTDTDIKAEKRRPGRPPKPSQTDGFVRCKAPEDATMIVVGDFVQTVTNGFVEVPVGLLQHVVRLGFAPVYG